MQALSARERWLIGGAVLTAVAFWLAIAWIAVKVMGRYLPDLEIEFRLAAVAAALILAYFAGYLLRTARLAWLRGHAVELGPKQYPDLHVRLRHAAKLLGIEPAPQAFLYHTHDASAGLSLRRHRQEIVALNADVIGVLTPRPGAIDFFFGYEITLLHDPLTRFAFWLAPALVLPVLGPANVRAAVYRADRGGLSVCRSTEDAEYALATLAARRAKPFNLVPFTGQREHARDFWMSMMELASGRPWLPYRLERLRAAAGLADPPRPRHAWGWLGALFLPALAAPTMRALVGRSLLFLIWLPLLGVLWLETHRLWYGPPESQAKIRTVNLRPAARPAPASPPVDAVNPASLDGEAYARVNADLRYLGELAETSSRKQGGIVCELGKLENLKKLQLSHARYAFSCGDPIVYTVIEPGEFESGHPSFLHAYHWKDKRFMPFAGAPGTSATP